VALVVDDYDEAIAFFVDRVGFELVEDSPASTNDGRPKRWVVVRPPGAATGILLAQADGPEQRSVVGRQHAGRVGFFLRVDEARIDASRTMVAALDPRLTPEQIDAYAEISILILIGAQTVDPGTAATTSAAALAAFAALVERR